MERSVSSSTVVLTFESHATLLGVMVTHLQTGPNRQPSARVRVLVAALTQVSLDWHADVELLTVDDGTPNLLLRGTVYTVEAVDAETVELDIRS